ncbi:hypothetical protein [Aliikangiella coralliicola]|uniref:Uncharacterized protein n=1 Tax=Aliikangiella coralliicola TaxID=2592383 RepID=A0A545TV32_9GAMM|nr:hypothetical protein [Aliikangiella coralliicola]TQV81078.1 hypothetical protein FLL46_26060 [Aliikangiella coralliicola]
MGFVYAVAALCSFLMLYLLIKSLAGLKTISKTKKGLSKAEQLSEQSSIGDYIYFYGRLSTPPTKAPINKKTCGYWGLIIKAVFTTRRKKPNKGLQTHRPAILKASSEDFPFMVSNGVMCAQMTFRSHLGLIVNSDKDTVKSNSPPKIEEQVSVKPEIWKAKYQSYESTIFSLPKNCQLTIWGKILKKTNSGFLLGDTKESTKPPLIFNGTRGEFLSKMANQTKLTILLVFLILGGLVAIWGWGRTAFEAGQFVTLSVVIAASVFIFGQYIKSLAKK